MPKYTATTESYSTNPSLYGRISRATRLFDMTFDARVRVSTGWCEKAYSSGIRMLKTLTTYTVVS
jgi:hypothetical protein